MSKNLDINFFMWYNISRNKFKANNNILKDKHY